MFEKLIEMNKNQFLVIDEENRIGLIENEQEEKILDFVFHKMNEIEEIEEQIEELKRRHSVIKSWNKQKKVWDFILLALLFGMPIIFTPLLNSFLKAFIYALLVVIPTKLLFLPLMGTKKGNIKKMNAAEVKIMELNENIYNLQREIDNINCEIEITDLERTENNILSKSDANDLEKTKVKVISLR